MWSLADVEEKYYADDEDAYLMKKYFDPSHKPENLKKQSKDDNKVDENAENVAA